ncbi:hypothetical protein Tco_0484705 [Tanacetum coccineum]
MLLKLKDMVRALTFDKLDSPTSAPAPVKAVEHNVVVTCGGCSHSFMYCRPSIATITEITIQEYVSQQAAANSTKEIRRFPSRHDGKQIRPPCFPPYATQQPSQHSEYWNQNQNCGKWLQKQGSIQRPSGEVEKDSGDKDTVLPKEVPKTFHPPIGQVEEPLSCLEPKRLYTYPSRVNIGENPRNKAEPLVFEIHGNFAEFLNFEGA